MALGKKIALLTTAGVILAVIVFGLLSLHAVDQATDAMLQDRLTTAGVVADYLDENLGRAVTELQQTAQSVDGIAGTGQLTSAVAGLQDSYRRLSIYTRGTYLVDSRGDVVWSQPGAPVLKDQDAAFYPSVNETLKWSEPLVSPLVRASTSDTPVVLLTSPTKASGAERGVLLVAIDLGQSSIGGFVKPIRLGQTGYVEVVDQNGVVVMRTEPGPKLSPFEKSDHSGRFAALITAGEPTRGLCHTCHEPVQAVERRDVLAFVPMSAAHWGVVIRQSEQEALTPINQLRQNLLFFAAGLIAVALFLVGITTRDIVSRIRVLTTASRKIAGGDLTSAVTSGRRDEIGDLARSFEEMRVKLKASREDLEGRTRELSSLLSVSEILTSLPDLSNLDAALSATLDKILEILKVEAGSIYLVGEHGDLEKRASRGMPGEGAGEGAGLGAVASVPLSSKEHVLGQLSVGSGSARQFSKEDVRLLEDVAGQIATAIENARLQQAVQREDQVRGELLKEVLDIQEEERRRIARELHDETSQVLASLSANLQAMAETLPPEGEPFRARLKQAQALSISVLDDIHRLIYELRPILLDDLGLVAAARWLADNNLKSGGIKVGFHTVGRTKRLPPQIEGTLFRVIQEALNNISRHAKAANADVSLRFKKGSIGVCVKDDGLGFDVDEAISSKARPRGLGLLGMKERVELVNGTLDIRSRPGEGTEVSIEIPLNGSPSNGNKKSARGGPDNGQD